MCVSAAGHAAVGEHRVDDLPSISRYRGQISSPLTFAAFRCDILGDDICEGNQFLIRHFAWAVHEHGGLEVELCVDVDIVHMPPQPAGHLLS